MYTPKDFTIADPRVAAALIRREPFGALISIVDGDPMITHVPFSIVQLEPTLRLSTHLAKANSHAEHLDGARVRIVFSGPHGYISPRWYTKPTRTVPTWNYMVVHCRGVARIASEAEKLAILAQLVDEMEAGADPPWSFAALDSAYRDEQAKHIVAFYIEVKSFEAKFKLSQNRTPADRTGAIAGLREPGPFQNLKLAAAMEAEAKR